jgi:HI0933-like protein
MCAVEAGKRGRRVVLLEPSNSIGKKILISGGGRCNFTNIHCQTENFISRNPHFAKSALARYTPSDFLALVRAHHIAYHEKTLGQLFCDRFGSRHRTNARDGMSARGSASRHRRCYQRGSTQFRFRGTDRKGPILRASTRCSHGRPISAENRGHFIRLRPRQAVRHKSP